jgi:hypothetical protein
MPACAGMTPGWAPAGRQDKRRPGAGVGVDGLPGKRRNDV